MILARQKINQILDQLSDSEIRSVQESTQGQSGLKALVKSKISRNEMFGLFPNEFDFNNRWNEVRKKPGL